jgi:hypothetical protein
MLQLKIVIELASALPCRITLLLRDQTRVANRGCEYEELNSAVEFSMDFAL